MSKRTCLLALTLLLAGTPSAWSKLDIVTTTSDLAWFVEQIGGDRVSVKSLTRGYQDPHYLEPKPSYIVSLTRADALVYVGLELEVGWLPKLLDGAHNPEIQEGRTGLYSPAGRIPVLEKPSGALDRAAGDVHPFGNPHYWLSPSNARLITAGVADWLAQLDPEGGERYLANADRLDRRIAERDREWSERLAAARGLKLVTYHTTYSYFADHFGLEVVDYVEPRPGVPPSSRHLSQLIARLKREDVRLLLVENFFDPRNAEFVASKGDVPLVIAPVSVGGEDDVEGWFELMEFLVSAIERARER